MLKRILLTFIIFGFGIFGQIFAQIKEKEDINSETIFENMYKLLQAKPKWLFSDEICPFKVVPKDIVKLKFSLIDCAENAESCLNKCKNSDGNSCYALALEIQEKKGISNDFSEALFQKACQLGIVSGCTNRAAGILNQSSNDKKSLVCVAKTFEKTCELNDSWGCAMFGMLLIEGEVVPRNKEKALRVLSKSCLNGEKHEACIAGKRLIDQIKNTPNQ